MGTTLSARREQVSKRLALSFYSSFANLLEDMAEYVNPSMSYDEARDGLCEWSITREVNASDYSDVATATVDLLRAGLFNVGYMPSELGKFIQMYFCMLFDSYEYEDSLPAMTFNRVLASIPLDMDAYEDYKIESAMRDIYGRARLSRVNRMALSMEDRRIYDSIMDSLIEKKDELEELFIDEYMSFHGLVEMLNIYTDNLLESAYGEYNNPIRILMNPFNSVSIDSLGF